MNSAKKKSADRIMKKACAIERKNHPIPPAKTFKDRKKKGKKYACRQKIEY